MEEKTQLEVRKFLKRLGINSQEKLHQFIQDNPSIKDIPIKVSFEINGKQDFTFEDKLKIITLAYTQLKNTYKVKIDS